MATIINYTSTETIDVTPTIVNISLDVSTKGATAKEAINKLIENRQLIKDFILSKQSYRPDTYYQSNININKKYKKMKVDEFNTMDVFDCYQAQIWITAVLNRSDSVIDDFVAISNMAIELDCHCSYKHDILEEAKEEIQQKLYAQCINNGLDNLKAIVLNTELKSKILNLLEVNEDYPRSYSSKCLNFSETICSNYEPEQIIIPELIEDLFNNNIVFNKTLNLKVSLV